MKKTKSTRKRKSKIIVAAVTPVLVVAAFVGFLATKKVVANVGYESLLSYDTAEDLEQRRRERDEAVAQAREAADRVAELTGEQEELTGELERLNGLSEEQREQYDMIAGQLAAALVEKAEALDAYVQAQDDLAAKQLQFAERISVMFEYQDKSYLEILLESDSIAGFFTNMEIISLIGEADNQMVQELTTAVENASHQADLALQEAEDLQEIVDQKTAQLALLEARIGVTTEALQNIETEISGWEQMEDEMEMYSQALSAQIAALQAQIDQQNAATATTTEATTVQTEATTQAVETEPTASQEPEQSDVQESQPEETAAPTATPTPVPTPTPAPVVSNCSLSWPTWSSKISSYYGNRVHPVYGTTKFHSGIDIDVGFGTTIMAAGSGTVILVDTPVAGQDWGGSGYGNYCVIDHGNGVTTLYAHARSINVSVGDYVSSGQSIGVVGSTGTSTGAHLHFEVRVNGSTVDPLSYLP